MAPSPRKSSPRKKTSSGSIYNDQTMQLMFLIVILVIGFSWYYLKYGTTWWTAVSSKVPSWGNSEWLILLMVLVFYIAFTMACMNEIRQHNTQQTKTVATAMFIFASVQVAVFAYLYSNDQQKYSYGYTNFTLLTILTAFLVYYSYSCCGRTTGAAMAPSVLALASVVYLMAWSYKVKTA